MTTPETTKVSSNAKRCVALHTRRSDASTLEAMAKANELLRAADIETISMSEVLKGREPEVLISFGGDGSLLHAARLMTPLNVPVLGVNYGRVGYLCAVDENGLETAVEHIANHDYAIEERSMLQCSIYHEGERVWESTALNEFLVGGCNRTVSLEVDVNDHTFATIRGDGLIVATKTGSTAYAFSAGGPVLLLDCLCLVASNAVFSSAIRSVVLPLDSTIRIRNHTKDTRPYVVADGQNDIQINQNSEIVITRAQSPALFLDLRLTPEIEALHRGFQDVMVRELGTERD